MPSMLNRTELDFFAFKIIFHFSLGDLVKNKQTNKKILVPAGDELNFRSIPTFTTRGRQRPTQTATT